MRYEQLQDLALFERLADSDLDAMGNGLNERRLGAGEMLFHQGDLGSECFVILHGSLEVFTFVNETELQLEVYSRGDLVGEMALIDRSPRSASVRALEASHVATLDEHAFKILVGSNPDLAMGLLQSSTTRVRNTNQRMIADLERKNAELLSAYRKLQAAQAELIRLNRLEEELAVARRIQQSFLPREIPQPAGWQVAAYSRGAQAVGGDFYDIIPLAADQVGLVVADACGKGVTAALFVVLTRSLLRAASIAPWIFQGGNIIDAESILTGALWMTNDYICREHADSDMFVTLFYGVLNVNTGDLAYVNAGHNPPLCVSSDGTMINELDGGTLPLGIMANQNYDVCRTVIGPGEQLVAFSDGITEAMNSAGEPYNDDRFHAGIRANAGSPAQVLLDTLITDVDAYAGTAPQADDMTLLIMQRRT